MARRAWKVLFLTLTVVAAGGLVSRSAAGHGAVIHLGAPAAAAGDSLGVTGEGLGEAAEVTIALEGAAGTRVLATLRGDVHGRFETVVLIPADTPPGAYRVVATAGEDRAVADLLVAAGVADRRMSDGQAIHAFGEAIPEAMDLQRTRSPLETGVLWAGVALLFALGVYLRRPRGG